MVPQGVGGQAVVDQAQGGRAVLSVRSISTVLLPGGTPRRPSSQP
jgi:hypothetical protein